MADDQPAPSSPISPLLLIFLIIAGSLIVIYERGDLKKLNARDFLLPPPIKIDTQTKEGSSTEESTPLKAYTVEPYANQAPYPNSQ